MILDSLKNSALYYSISPRLKRVFEYIATTNLAALEVGRHIIDGDDIFANVMDPELKKPEDAKLELHNKYIDIQILIDGDKEDFGWSERADVKQPQGTFDVDKDIQFFDDKPQTYYTLKRGQFTILMPEDAHAPMVGTGRVKKMIVKVKV